MGTPLGRIVDPESLFGRERELARTWDLLIRTGSNILLSAPRRVGKSSFLKRLEYDAPARGFRPVFLSLPDCQSEDQFVQRLLNESWKQDGQKPWFSRFADSAAGKVLQSVKAGEYAFDPHQPKNWDGMARAVQEMLQASEEPKLMLIDELPLFVAELLRLDPGRARARRFLGWMKTLRENTRHRWVLAGSIGLDTIARRGMLSGTIADLHVETDFGPFTRELAEAFVRREAAEAKLDLDPAELHRILELTANYHLPYYLVLLLNELHRCRSEREAFSETGLLDKRVHFSHWDERLGDIFGVGTRGKVDAVLGRAAAGPEGIQRDEALTLAGPVEGREILEVLVNDGYLERRQDRLAFRCELVRRYWERFIVP